MEIITQMFEGIEVTGDMQVIIYMFAFTMMMFLLGLLIDLVR